MIETPEAPARTSQQPGRRRRPQRHNGAGGAAIVEVYEVP